MEDRKYKHYLLVMLMGTFGYPLFKLFVHYSYDSIEAWYFRMPTLLFGLGTIILSKYFKKVKDNLDSAFLVLSLITTVEFMYLLSKFYGTPFEEYYFIGSFVVTICLLVSFKLKKHFQIYLSTAVLGYAIYFWNAYQIQGYHFSVSIFNGLVFVGTALILVSIQVWNNIRSDIHLTETTELLEANRVQLVNSSKLASLGEMAGGIAHEINNPLQIISGSVEILEINPNHIESLENIKLTVSRISKIVDGLRLFSRDGESTSLEPTKIRDVIDETLSFCLERFKQNKINVNLDIPAELYINCNHIEISRVFLNLLNNAFDAIGDSCKEKSVKISAKQLKEKVQIRFYDSGKQITQETKDKLFQPFFTTKSIGKGTGLGLSISKGVIQKHGGDIFIELEPKCFVIELPLNGV